MICHKCKELIEPGEACIPEAINGSNHYHYFHAGCYAEWKKEKKDDSQIQYVATLARTIH